MLSLLLLQGALAAPLDYSVFGFYDLPKDCNEMEARYGHCIERVQLINLKKLSKPALEGFAIAYGGLWEDLAHRWSTEGVTTLMSNRDYPMPSKQWSKKRIGKWSYALPKNDKLRIDVTSLQKYYPKVKVLSPNFTVPNTIRMGGRFVERLGYDGKSHPFEIMSADRKSSAPFYEQLYPYDPKTLKDLTNIPFRRFSSAIPIRPKKQQATKQNTEQKMRSAQKAAQREFKLLFDGISNIVVRYASGDYTENHIRILAALTLMKEPPSKKELQKKGGGRLVAASLGQTDTRPEERGRFENNYTDRTLSIDVTQLPDPVLNKWIRALKPAKPLSKAAVKEILKSATLQLREKYPPFPGLKDAHLWIRTAILPGAVPEQELLRLKQAHLNYLLNSQKTSASQSDLRDFQLMLDHFTSHLSDDLNSKGGTYTPQSMVDMTSGSWESVLKSHGINVKPFPQQQGRVDPVAICTTKDGKEALGEEAIKPIFVDMLVDAPRDLKSAEEVLWASKTQLPFIMLDNPYENKPDLTVISNLPNKQALYRIRWSVWSGWHLVWNFHQPEYGEMEVRGHTTAFCENMLLTSEDLMPTILRASLLHEMLPTTPASMQTLAKMGMKKLKTLDKKTPETAQAKAPFHAIRDTVIAPLTKEGNEKKGNLTIVLESDPTSHRGLNKGKSRATPYYQLRHARHWTNAWAYYLPANAQPMLFLPQRTALQATESTTPIPQWSSEPTMDWMIDFGIGSILQYKPNENSETTASSEQSPLEWNTLELGVSRVNWFNAVPRIGWDMSSRLLIDLHRNELFSNFDNAIHYQGEIMFGIRRMSSPALWNKGPHVWGPGSIQSRKNLSRYQYGLRGGLVVGQGFEQSPLSLCAEAWTTYSPGSGIGSQKELRPYHPTFLIGPFIRGEAIFDDSKAPYRGYSVIMGLRSHFRLSKPPKELSKTIEAKQPPPKK